MKFDAQIPQLSASDHIRRLPILERSRGDIQRICHLFLSQAKPLPSSSNIETLLPLVGAMSNDISGTEKLFNMAKIVGPVGAVERMLAHNLAHAESKIRRVMGRVEDHKRRFMALERLQKVFKLRVGFRVSQIEE